MRILALVTDAFGAPGGIARYNRDFFKALSEADPGSFTLVLPRSAHGKEFNLSSNLTQEPGIQNKFLYAFRAIGTAFFRGPFDLIFCGHLYHAPLAFLLSRFLRIPFWLQLYGVEVWKDPPRIVYRSADRSAGVTAISRYTRKEFLKRSRINPGRVKVLPNTYEERFSPGPKPDLFLKKHGLADKKILLTVGRLSSREGYKGHDRVIALLPELLKIQPDLLYVIAGDGDDRPRLQKKVLQQGLDAHVRFLGYVDDVQLPELYRCADYFAMPSTGEGFGNVFLEAMACGVPVLGGNCDGSPDPLQDGNTGIIVDPTDPEKLMEGLEKLLRGKSPNGNASVFSYANFKRHVRSLFHSSFHPSPAKQTGRHDFPCRMIDGGQGIQ